MTLLYVSMATVWIPLSISDLSIHRLSNWHTIDTFTTTTTTTTARQTSCWHVTNTRVAPAVPAWKMGACVAPTVLGGGERNMWKIMKEKKWKRFACKKNAECEINMFVKFQLCMKYDEKVLRPFDFEFIDCRQLGMRCCCSCVPAVVKLYSFLGTWLMIDWRFHQVRNLSNAQGKLYKLYERNLSCVKNCLKKIMSMVGYWQLTYDTYNFLGIGWIHQVEVAQLW